MALESSEDVRIAAEKRRGLTGSKIAAFSEYLPHLVGGLSYSKKSRPTFGGGASSNPAFTSDQLYAARLGARQDIYSGWATTNRFRRAGADADAAEAEESRVRAEVVYQTTRGYFEALYRVRLTEIATAALRNAESHEAVARSRYKTGEASEFDVSRARVQTVNQKTARLRARQDETLARERLARLIGRPVDGDILDVGEFKASRDSGLPASLDEALSRARAGRPELRAAEADFRARGYDVGIARSLFRPSLSATGEYLWQNGQASLSNLDERWNAGVNLDLPLFDGLLAAGKVKEAKAQAHAAEARREKVTEEVVLDVREAYAVWLDARERLDAQRENVDLARDNLSVAEKRYRTGENSYLDLQDAQLSLTQAEVNHAQSVFDHLSARAALARATGATGLLAADGGGTK